MDQDSRLKDIRKRLHASLDRLAAKQSEEAARQFNSMTPAQLFQYHISHPEDTRLEDYILNCSHERQEQIQQAAEQLEQEIRYGDF